MTFVAQSPADGGCSIRSHALAPSMPQRSVAPCWSWKLFRFLVKQVLTISEWCADR